MITTNDGTVRFQIQADYKHNVDVGQVVVYANTRAEARAACNVLEKTFACVWLAEWGRYVNREAEEKDDWMCYSWSEATKYGPMTGKLTGYVNFGDPYVDYVSINRDGTRDRTDETLQATLD